MSARWAWVLVVAGVACSPAQSGTQLDSPVARDAPQGSAGSDAFVPPVDATSAVAACQMVAAARCDKLMSCSPADLAHRFGDLATCEDREALACRQNLAAPDTGATGNTMLACGSAVSAESCDAFFAGPAPADCIPAGPGAGTCAFAAQCSTSYCSVGANTLCGLCQDSPLPGASCASAGCGQTLVCNGNNDLCATPAGSGASCNPTVVCGHGLACVGYTKQQNGKCQPVIATVGGSCDQTRKQRADCSGDAGLTCNRNTNKCVAQPLVGAGSACGPINGVQTDCAAGASCVIPTGQSTGTCVAAPGDGSACDTKGADCLSPARCIPTAPPATAGTCELPGSKTC